MPVALRLFQAPRGPLPVFAVGGLEDLGLDAFVTGRHGGVSSAPFDSLNLATHVGDDPACVQENRRRVAEALQVQPQRLVTSSQVHGAVVNDVDGWDGEALVGDALITSRHDLAIGVLVADCVPLLFVESGGPTFALAHAGWRGLAAGVIAATLDRFRDPPALHVVIGPHVSPTTYQVGAEVAGLFEAVPSAVRTDASGRRYLDLGAIAVHQLRRGGVRDAHITVCSPETDGGTLFFSDRAQRPSGRFAFVARAATYAQRVQVAPS